jgi:predicted nucleotidyltransferase
MEIKNILKEFRRSVEKLYGQKLKSIILYGSWARGDHREESDIDLLVVLKGTITPGKEIDRMIDIITEINLKYGILISVYPVSEKNYSTVNSPLLINVRQEGIHT